MKEKTKREEETGTPFSVLIHQLDTDKGITARDYFDALDCQVKVPLQTAYLELCELISGLPKDDMDRADNFLQIQRSAFMLWEQMDKKMIEDYKAHGAEHDFLIKQRDEWEKKFQAAEEARLIASRHLSYYVTEESQGRLHIDPIPRGANLRRPKETVKKNGSNVKRAA